MTRKQTTAVITVAIIFAIAAALILTLANPFNSEKDQEPDGPTNPATESDSDTATPSQSIPLRTGTITITLQNPDGGDTTYQSPIQVCDLHLDPPGILATNPNSTHP